MVRRQGAGPDDSESGSDQEDHEEDLCSNSINTQSVIASQAAAGLPRGHAEIQPKDSSNSVDNEGGGGGGSVSAVVDQVEEGSNTVDIDGETVQLRRSVSAGNEPMDWEGHIFAGEDLNKLFDIYFFLILKFLGRREPCIMNYLNLK